MIGYQRGDALDHFIVVEKVGEGAMGEVIAAYDPDLDRKVAVKLLRPRDYLEADEQAVARLFSEARAMAKLSHPNVAAVHEVGLVDDHVFIAMEYIAGVDGRAWLQQAQRSDDEILAVFLAAGRGLAAAHTAGIVHRDFKPSNVMVGQDGRVRVVDFGLARPPTGTGRSDAAPVAAAGAGDLTRTGAIVGTPAYMAPEQQLGQAVDARSDQFSFCVALYEALARAHPFPGETPLEISNAIVAGRRTPASARVRSWLRPALERGMAPARRDRYPGMGALLADLDPDRRRRRRRWLGAALAAFVAAVLSAVTAVELTNPETLCSGGDRFWNDVWNDDSAARVTAAFAATGHAHAAAQAARAAAVLQDYIDAWVDSHRSSCEATRVYGEQSEELLDVRQRCYERRLSEAGALVRALATVSEPAAVDSAVKAIYELTAVGTCADVAALTARVPLPDDPEQRRHVEEVRDYLDDVRSQMLLGSYVPALERAKQLERDTDESDFAPLRAEALSLLGDLQAKTNESEASVDTLRRALVAAGEARDDRLKAAIGAQLIYVLGNLRDERDEALALESSVLADAARAGGAADLLAGAHNSLGAAYGVAGDNARSEQEYRQAVELYVSAFGEEHPRVATALNNVGVALREQSHADEATTFYQRALAIREKVLTADHPDVGNCYNNLGVVASDHGDIDRAVRYYDKALAVWEGALGSDNQRVAVVTNNIGSLYIDRGDYDRAREYFDKSRGIRERLLGAEHQYTLRVRENIATVMELQGRREEALAELQQILALNKKVLGEKHPGVAYTLNQIGNVLVGMKRYRDAIPYLEQSIALGDESAGSDNEQQGWPHVNLGRAWLGLGDTLRARAEVERAVAIWLAAQGEDGSYLAGARVVLGRVLNARGEHREALEVLSRVLATRERSLGPEHRLVGQTLIGIGEAELGLGQKADAVATLERAVSICEQAQASSADSERARAALARARR
jgi:tetratricopeptide (TPR) repeat protein/tRNA A-37 threonylcarbamoyl transferase component Bud32